MNREAPHLILVADDDSDIRSLLRILLEKDGYRVLEAANGREAVAIAEDRGDELSLILLDILMPELNGIEAAQKLRDLTDVPILFLTACSSDTDKARAYGSGGDDYIVKPFHSIDLRLKLQALIRRYERYQAQKNTREASPVDRDCIHFSGDVEWYPQEKAVYRLGERVVLTEREYRLFTCLGEARGENLTPAVLYETVWGEPYLSTSSNTVIVHIANLRRKLEKDPSSPTLIRTVWGKGYRID